MKNRPLLKDEKERKQNIIKMCTAFLKCDRIVTSMQYSVTTELNHTNKTKRTLAEKAHMA